MTRVFVYGTLVIESIRRRIAPSARVVGGAYLEGWRRTERGGLPNIERETVPGEGILGVLLEVDREDLAALDYYEGVEVGLYRREKVKVDVGAESIDADVYVMGSGSW